ncbi:hypothetical protein GDO81_003231 [Engystomops pustulosus]|uniref:Uncharacterized protein n=1 Tax=Engystomops pustulosus TaxID=76066 RepID=A0AAV7A3Z7_ENGPU|nr:hypothetical protein GDO81_003231 [Engystomops pustulosus]
MAAGRTVCKAGVWLLAAYVILSLQGADAQTNTTTGPAVPGWGIALLVLMSIFLAGILFCVCCAVRS